MNDTPTIENTIPTGGVTVDKKAGHKKPRIVKKRGLSDFSPRMKKAAALMVENGGAMSQALRQAGYSESIAHNPQKVTRSRSWQELMMLVDDEPLVARVRGIALGGSDRDSLAAVQLIQRWKGRDATTLKLSTLNDELSDVTQPNEATETPSDDTEILPA